jgi:hypothetical protein
MTTGKLSPRRTFVMEKRRILATIVLTCFLCMVFGTFVEEALAAGGGTDMMDKKGIGGLFEGRGDKDDPRKPTKAQKYLGFGSLVVMVLVVKYL